MWHFELTNVTARLFAPGMSFGDPFTTVAQIDLHLDGTAFAHGMLAVDGKPLRRHHFVTLLIQLRQEHHIRVVEALRGSKRVRWCTETLRRI